MQYDTRTFSLFIAEAQTSPLWQDDALLKLYLYCLSRITSTAYEWRGMIIQPGNMPFAEREAAQELCWSRNKLKRKLKLLSDAGLIEMSSLGKKGTLLHITDQLDASSVYGSKMKPLWVHDGSTSICNGSTVKPEDDQDEAINGSILNTSWVRGDTSKTITGSEMDPSWLHHGAIPADHGITMDPSSIDKNIYSISSIQREPKGFTKLWLSYPLNRRTARAEAAALVCKALADGATIEQILDALETDKQSFSWQQDNGRYIPGIVKWLQKEAWRNQDAETAPVEDPDAWISR